MQALMVAIYTAHSLSARFLAHARKPFLGFVRLNARRHRGIIDAAGFPLFQGSVRRKKPMPRAACARMIANLSI
jgi:hypothetical protein